jgi:glycosyltransferase involved in cell wall biosynthesis
LELVVIDDGSTDNTYKIAKEFARKDARVRVFTNKTHMGISYTANRGILKTKGQFLARMDADDIALPDRLKKQVAYLAKHKKTVAIGGFCYIINKTGKVIGRKTFPTSFEEIYHYIFRFIPVQQGTLMIARFRLPKNFQFYEDGMNTAEEVELFFKLFQHGRVENMPDYLLAYRMHDSNTSFANLRATFLLTLIARIKAIYRYGYTPELSGALMTGIQTITVLLLPKKITLMLYKSLRFMRMYRLPHFSFSITFPERRISPTSA